MDQPARPKLPPGPGRPRSDVRVARYLKLQPEIDDMLTVLKDTCFKGNRHRAIEHCIRFATAGLDVPAPASRRRAAPASAPADNAFQAD